MKASSCIVDNWSLECAALVLEDGLRSIQAGKMFFHLRVLGDHIAAGIAREEGLPHHVTDLDTPSVYFGAPSNVLNALVLFDSLGFADNGFDSAWRQYTEFAAKMSPLLHALAPPQDERCAYNGDLALGGARFYLEMARTHGADILLNPVRSGLMGKALNIGSFSYREYVEDLLSAVDNEVKTKLTESPSEILRMGAIPNLSLPPVFHMVLSNASSRTDVLDVAIQMRELRTRSKSACGGMP